MRTLLQSTFALVASAASLGSAPEYYQYHDTLLVPPQEIVSPASNSAITYIEPTTSQAPFGLRPISPNGSQWAVTYVPFTPEGQCKTAKEIARDARTVSEAGFTTMRLYSTDCDVLSALKAPARKHNLGLAVGVHVSDDAPGAAIEQLEDILEFGAWELVEMVVLGNEALWNDQIGLVEMVTFVGEARELLRNEGYNGPITTIEPPEIWEAFRHVLCPQVDVVSANIQPYFDGSVAADDAGIFVAAQLRYLEGVCRGGKEAFNLETGWPRAGLAHGRAVAGPEQQRTAIAAMREQTGSRSAFHGFEDDLWKEADALGVERHFGCLAVFSSSTTSRR